ncbi:hypothetical protein [Winogradskyella pulchriflava]|uniref:Uncharacterized protein n=1 Tax=Winogradskyella pulchriflava TaxID=1110688 RepID=A0ABV6Q9N5_9FLAO
MRTDSFKNLSGYKDLINEKLSEFILSFENAPKKTKKLLHYQSVINLSKEIIRFNNSEANKLKDLMLEYFEIVKDFEYYDNINNVKYIHDKRKQSLDLYQKHLRPVGSYLIQESDFGPDLSLRYFLICGITLDIIIYSFFSKSIVPLSTILVIIIGIKMRNKKRKEGRTFSVFK